MKISNDVCANFQRELHLYNKNKAHIHQKKTRTRHIRMSIVTFSVLYTEMATAKGNRSATNLNYQLG